MRKIIITLLALSALLSCSNQSSNLPQLSVDFVWPENHKCFDERSPKITMRGIPDGTQSFHINMFDLDARYDHGGGTFVYDGSNVIPEGTLKDYRGPCPSYGSPRYQLSVKAIDENGKVLALGEKTRKYPPEPN